MAIHRRSPLDIHVLRGLLVLVVAMELIRPTTAGNRSW